MKLRRARLLIFAGLASAGCGQREGGINISGPGVNVKVNPNGTTSVQAPGVDIKTGPKGANVKAPGVGIKAGENGADIQAPGVDIKARP